MSRHILQVLWLAINASSATRCQQPEPPLFWVTSSLHSRQQGSGYSLTGAHMMKGAAPDGSHDLEILQFDSTLRPGRGQPYTVAFYKSEGSFPMHLFQLSLALAVAVCPLSPIVHKPNN